MTLIEQLKKLAIAASDEMIHHANIDQDREFYFGKLSAYLAAIELVGLETPSHPKQSIPGVPEGWELVEFRKMKTGDHFVSCDGCGVQQWTLGHESFSVFPILRKIETTEPSE